MLKALLVLVCALAATALTATTSIAVAQEPGVTVDPGSPSGKEYALPVDRARQQASRSKKTTGGTKSPLFGEGVNDNSGTGGTAPSAPTAKTTTTPNPKSADKAQERAAAAAAKARADARAKAAAAEAEAARQLDLERTRELRAQASTPDGGIGVGGIIALGVAVLLVGGGIGLWLRRRAATPT